MRGVCICCPKRSSRVPQILTRRSESALGLGTAAWAAENGHLHILEYLVERKYDEYDEYACEYAAKNGHLDCLKYLHETAKAPWDSRAVRFAHENNHPECLQYLLDNNCPYHTVGDTNMESCTHRNNHHLHHIKHTYILHA